MFLRMVFARRMFANFSGRSGPARHLGRAIWMRQFLFAAACWVAAAMGSAALGGETEPEFAIETAKTKTVKAVDSFEVYGPQVTAKAWVLIAIQAPS